MKQRTAKSAEKKYPYLPFRPTPLQERRLRALGKITGQKLGSLLRECVSAHLPILEAHAAVKR